MLAADCRDLDPHRSSNRKYRLGIEMEDLSCIGAIRIRYIYINGEAISTS